jgi:predicted membrane-bound spermidine synthase
MKNGADQLRSQAGKRTRRLLLATIFVSAGAGAAFSAAASLWISERSEALVLFILFVSVILYVVAEAGFGQMLIQSVRDFAVDESSEAQD